jgi:exoribonuclease-2
MELMPERLDDVVEFLDSGALKLGWVKGEGFDKIQVIDVNGRHRSLPAKRVLIRHNCISSENPGPSGLRDLMDQIRKLQAEVDTELLWESICEDGGRQFGAEELAEIYFGSADSLRQSAVYRAVLHDSVRFKVRLSNLIPRSPAQVESQFLAAQKRDERRAFKERSINWMLDVLTGQGRRVSQSSTEAELLLRRLEGFLSNRQDEEVRLLLVDLTSHPELSGFTPVELAIGVLSAEGRLPKGVDPYLIEAGIEAKFPKEALDEVEKIPKYARVEARIEFDTSVVFTIDDEDTLEIDDALAVEVTDKRVRVGIHIADTAHFIEKESALDREASRRSSSIYLPHCTVRMFPDLLSCDRVSLVQGQLRPTMSFTVDFTPEGELLSWHVGPGQVCVSNRLTYDEADRLIDSEDRGGLAGSLRSLNQVAQGLHAVRAERGALTLKRPELKIRVENGETTIKVLEPTSTSRRLVSEMMILANSLAASYAKEQHLPIIFRTQEVPAGIVTSPDEYDPVATDYIFSKLEKSKLSLVPEPHAGLGLDAYTQLTSPIRRFTDLVIQRQLAAYLEGEPLPYDKEEMMGVLGKSLSMDSDTRTIERRANRKYLLEYLAQHYLEESLSAVVLRNISAGYLVETQELFVRGLLADDNSYERGQEVTVRIARIDPERNNLVFASV